MKRLALLILLLSVSSCSKVDDDSQKTCTADCTTIRGRIITANNEPIPDVKLTFRYKRSAGTFSSFTRILDKVKTNDEGWYEMSFYIKDEELGENQIGHFRLEVDGDSFDTGRFLLTNTVLTRSFTDMPIRDTIISQGVYVPTRTTVQITLNDFAPIAEGDRFEVRTFFPYGFEDTEAFPGLNSDYGSSHSGFGNHRAVTSSDTFEVVAAADEDNIVNLLRINNGVITEENISIFVPEDNNISLSYSY